MGQEKKVLAAISEPRVLAALEDILARNELEFHQVANGEACLILAATTPYDIVLAQLPLFDMSAPALLTSLLAPGAPSSNAQVLFLASGGQASAAAALGQGRHSQVTIASSTEEFRLRLTQMLGVALRASARVLVNLHVGLEESRSTHVYETENLSRSGMLLRTAHPLAIGTQFAFDICLPEPDAALQGRGSVVRHTEPNHERILGMGVRIDGLDGGAEDSLDSFVRQRRYHPA